jgi:hypothetical protein
MPFSKMAKNHTLAVTGPHTRKSEIESAKGFNSQADHVYMIGMEKMSEMKERLAATIDDSRRNGFGPTAELSVYSHSYGRQGPQMAGALSNTDWKDMNFNWNGDGSSIAAFYGCFSSSFAARFREMQSGVGLTAGQTGYAYPSESNTEFDRSWLTGPRDRIFFVGREPGFFVSGKVFPSTAILPMEVHSADGTIINASPNVGVGGAN